MSAPEAPDAADLRADLAEAGYAVDALAERLGVEAEAALHRGDRVPALRALRRRGADPCALLARLFMLGDALGDAELRIALPRAAGAAAWTLGLVVRAGDGTVRAARDVRPYAFTDERGDGEWWIVSDPGELTHPGPLPVDHVLGVGGASLTLAASVVPGEAGRALDLGSGCGIQALHLSRRAESVVATDLSARAVATTRLNALLNGVDSIEVREGDLFGPVAGERFDLVVSNPPFVITPRDPAVPAYAYRDGGRYADGIVEEVVAAAADVLAPGGLAQLLGNWEYRAGADGMARLLSWVGPEVDAWVIEREALDPAQYAETWIRDGGTGPGPEFERLVAAWLDDFAARDVRRIGLGLVVLRRREEGDAPPALRRADRLSEPLGPGTPLGAHLATCLAAERWLAGVDDEELAATRLVVAPDVTEERHYWPGSADPSAIALRQGGGFRRVVAADTVVAGVVGACDGELPVGVLLDATAGLLDADPVAVREAALPRIRELISDGMLLVAAPGDG